MKGTIKDKGDWLFKCIPNEFDFSKINNFDIENSKEEEEEEKEVNTK